MKTFKFSNFQIELITRALKISAAELADSHPAESDKFSNLFREIKYSEI
jgi:hypothetical protein